MKKLLFVAAVASAFGLFADGEGESAGTQVLEVGVTRITSPLKNTVIAISYDSLTGDIATADRLVKTTNLTPQLKGGQGDQLIAFDNGNYKVWTLQRVGEENVWEADADNGNPGPDPAGYEVAYGSGIWLVRNGDLTKPFYIYGKPASATALTVSAGATVLVGNPTTSNKAPTIKNAQPGDTILIPSATIPKQVKCALLDKTNPDGGVKWGGFGITGIPEINANTGFWYIAAGEGGARTISWE